MAPAVDTPGSAVSAPRLSFACELDAERLTELFADDKLIDQLRDLGARVLMMVSDHDPRRAQVVQRLNHAEVPVVGIPWFPPRRATTSPPTTGSGPNMITSSGRLGPSTTVWCGTGWAWTSSPTPASTSRSWTTPGAGRPAGTAAAQPRAPPARPRRLPGADGAHLRRRLDGGELPVPAPRRGATRRLHAAAATARTGRRPHRPRSLDALQLLPARPARPGAAVELRSRGPGYRGRHHRRRTRRARPPPDALLSWEQFARDLRLARHWSDTIVVHSLEGCVWHGYLSRLRGFDWSGAQPPRLVSLAGGLRAALQVTLWASAHSFLLTTGTLALILSRGSRRP